MYLEHSADVRRNRTTISTRFWPRRTTKSGSNWDSLDYSSVSPFRLSIGSLAVASVVVVVSSAAFVALSLG